MDISIRRAVASESALLAPLLLAYAGESVTKLQEPDLAKCELWINDRLESNEGIYFLATETGRVIGFATLFPQFDSIALARQWSLNDLFVLDAYRGRGIATRLLAELYAYARDSGAKYIELETATSNEIARKLYRRHGYYESSQYVRLYVDLK